MKKDLICLFVIIISLTGFGQSLNNDDKLITASSLFGKSSTSSFHAAEALFDGKEKSIPLLISYFDDATPYYGYLGANIQNSTNKQSRPVTKKDLEAIEKYKKAQKEGKQISEDAALFQKCGSKKDAALYLVVAILKNDFFHSETFKPKRKSEIRYQTALGELAIKYIRCETEQRTLTWENIKPILNKYSISFD